jgi:hypothetical protein
MINTSSADWRRLPFSEWAMLSMAMIYFSKLCQTKIANMDTFTAYDELIQTERDIWLSSIDRLCDRLEEASTTTTQENTCCRRTPDYFYLFNTVLKIFKENFVRDCMVTQKTPLSSSQKEEEEGSSCRRSTSRSQCPVMNGDIQHTDYWDMLMDDTQNYLGDMGCPGAEADLDINDPAYFDLTSWLDISI